MLSIVEVIEKYSFNGLKNRLVDSNSQIEYLLNYSFDDFVKLSTRLKDYYSEVKKFFERNEITSENREVRKSYLDAINHLIIDLQFHDIIRQKLEHIEEVHKSIIDELEETDPNSNLGNTKFICIIPEISILHTLQLKGLRKEYNDATNDIGEALDELIHLGKRAEAMGAIDHEDTERHAREFNKVVGKLKEDLQQINTSFVEGDTLSPSQEVLDKLEIIESIYTMKSERDVFNNLFGKIVEEDEDDIELF
jgi:predicted RNA-binding protein with EMAP domain